MLRDCTISDQKIHIDRKCTIMYNYATLFFSKLGMFLKVASVLSNNTWRKETCKGRGGFFTVSSSKYGRLSSSFQAVNPIFHFMITSSKPAMVCNTTPLKDKRLKTESRTVTPCQQECGHAIKRQLETEGSICTSFFFSSGSCLITSTTLRTLRPGLIFCWRDCGQGNLTAEFLPPTQTSSLEPGGDGFPTAGWTDMKERAFTWLYHAFP